MKVFTSVSKKGFPAYGVRFISINDHYDSDNYGENPAGLDLAIRNLINEMYSKDISRKIKSAVDLKKDKVNLSTVQLPTDTKKGKLKIPSSLTMKRQSL